MQVVHRHQIEFERAAMVLAGRVQPVEQLATVARVFGSCARRCADAPARSAPPAGGKMPRGRWYLNDAPTSR